jgi:DNA-binding NarL/FixJ family response regulator
MNGRKSLTAIRSTDQTFTIHPKAFVFFHKKTGTQGFEVKANADGSMPVNHVARLLALHCVMRGQAPEDFGVAVTAGEDLLNGLGMRAEKLIQDCQMFQSPVRLTKRQEEVLHEVLLNQSNKEIAGKVNLSVRTVKFHISALLLKFGVANRMGLMRKSVDLFSEGMNSTQPTISLLMADAALGSGLAGGQRARETGASECVGKKNQKMISAKESSAAAH